MAGKAYMNIPREEIPWYPAIDPQKCTDCGSCLEFCSNGVFEQGEDGVMVAQPYNCVVGCRSCQRICPNEAIGFPSQEELLEILKRLRERHAAESRRPQG